LELKKEGLALIDRSLVVTSVMIGFLSGHLLSFMDSVGIQNVSRAKAKSCCSFTLKGLSLKNHVNHELIVET
jgi:hypothetical protein